MYRKFLVKDNDQFNPEFFSFVIDDAKMIREQTDHVLPTFKTEIILSFLKNHSLESEWLNVNPELAKLISSGSLSTGKLKSLFDSCQDKPVFRQQMEAFLRQELSWRGCCCDQPHPLFPLQKKRDDAANLFQTFCSTRSFPNLTLGEGRYCKSFLNFLFYHISFIFLLRKAKGASPSYPVVLSMIAATSPNGTMFPV